MKKIKTMFSVLILLGILGILSIPAMAQYEDPIEPTAEEVRLAGVTPDSPLWGLELALERITDRLATSDTKRAENALNRLLRRIPW